MSLLKAEIFSKKEPKDFAQLIEILIQENKREITTKELKELGFSKYQIGKLEEQQMIERVKKGLYLVPKVIEKQEIEEKNNKIKIHRTNFNLFKCSVLEKDYKKAYQYLCDTINTRINHEYDDHYYLYLKLLKGILGEVNYDFSMLENGDIYITTDSYESGSTMEIFKNFKHSVLSGDFEKASNYINEYETKRKKHGHMETQISTRLFLILTNEICEKKKENMQKEKKQHFSQFYIKLREKNFKGAYHELYKVIDFKEKNHYALFFILLKEILQEENYDFSFLENSNNIVLMPMFIPNIEYDSDLLQKFKDAVLSKDFTSAKEYIQKEIEIEKRKNKSIRMQTEIYFYLINEVVKKQSICIKNTDSAFVIPAFDIQNPEEEKPKLEYQNLNRSNIQDLISKKRYTEAKALIQKNLPVNDKKDALYFQNILRMLNVLENLELGKVRRLIDTQPSICYRNSEDNPFAYFFEALNKEDFETAYTYALKCSKIQTEESKKTNNFETYVQLLNSILLYQRIKKYTHKKELTIEDLIALKELYQEKIKFSTKSKQYDMYVLDILNTLEEISNSNNKGNFCKVKTNRNNIIRQFEDMMNLGDYNTARQIMYSNEWREETKEFSYKDQIVLINKVLKIIAKLQQGPITSMKSEKPLEESPIILEQLQQLKDFIEKDDFEECKKYLQENMTEGNSSFLDELKELLNCLSKLQKISAPSEESQEEKQYKLGSMQ